MIFAKVKIFNLYWQFSAAGFRSVQTHQCPRMQPDNKGKLNELTQSCMELFKS